MNEKQIIVPPPKHDEIFKAVMEIPFIRESVLDGYLPKELKNRLDIKSFYIAESNFISKTLQKRHSDVVLRGDLDGNKGKVFIIVEHQSSNDKKISLRISEYKNQIIRRYMQQRPKPDRAPLILSILVTNLETDNIMPLSLVEMSICPELEKKYGSNTIAVDLKNFRAKPANKDPVDLFKQILQARGDNVLDILESHIESLKQMTKISKDDTIDYIEKILNYNANVISQENQERIDNIMASIFSKKVKKPAVSLYDSWVMKGVDKGLREGIEKGREEGLEEGKALVAKSLMGKLSIPEIAECTGLEIEQLNKIKNQTVENGVRL